MIRVGVRKPLGICGLAALIAAASAFGALGSPQIPQQADRAALTRQVYKSVAETTSFRVACPAGWLAANGTAVASGQGTGIIESWEAGVRGWRFRTISLREASAVVTCIRSSGDPAISSRDATRFVHVPEGQSLAATVACPSGQQPVGAGFELESSLAASRGVIPPPATLVAFTTMKSLARGWRFGLAGYRAADVSLLVRCISTSREGLRAVRVSRRVEVPPRRSQRLTHRCLQGSAPIFAGWASPRREVSVRGTIGRYQRPLYFVSNPSDRAGTVSLDLLCIR